MNPLSLQGKAILVTGASSGIGRETAILLSELEATVVLTGRDRSRLEQTRETMKGSDHLIQPFELRDAEDIPGLVKQITAKTGPLHGLVHSAGLQQTIPVRSLTVLKTEDLMRINFTTAVMLVKAFRQKGCYSRGSSIVLLSSVAGLTGRPAISIYAASKAALIGFSKAVALELAPDGIRVNCVAPGYVATEMWGDVSETLTGEQFEAIRAMHPLGIGNPRDVAHSIAFLLAETGRWITGTTLVVDGGYTSH